MLNFFKRFFGTWETLYKQPVSATVSGLLGRLDKNDAILMTQKHSITGETRTLVKLISGKVFEIDPDFLDSGEED